MNAIILDADNRPLANANTFLGSITEMGTEILGMPNDDNTGTIGMKVVVLNGPVNGSALAPSASVLTTQLPSVTGVTSTALETSHILKAAAGQLCHLSVFNSKGSAQFILIMNSPTLPANGAVPLLYPPIPIAANTLLVINFERPIVASLGITVTNSSTGTFSLTIGSVDCAFFAQVN